MSRRQAERDHLDERSRELCGPVTVTRVDPRELRTASASSSQWWVNRRRNRAAGLDRYGNELPRVAGTNPRALGTNPRARGTNPIALGLRDPIPADTFLDDR